MLGDSKVTISKEKYERDGYLRLKLGSVLIPEKKKGMLQSSGAIIQKVRSRAEQTFGEENGQ